MYQYKLKGKSLDRLGVLVGLKHQKRFFLFRESDKSFRRRLLAAYTSIERNGM